MIKDSNQVGIKNRRFILSIVITGGSFFLANGILFVWPLAWLSAIPMLILLPRVKKLQIFLYSFFAYLIGASVYLLILRDTAPLMINIVTVLLFSVIFALIYLVTKILSSKVPSFIGVFVFPIIWTVSEYLIFTLSINGTWGSIANTQIEFIPFIQIASITGIWGIVFIISLFSSLISYIWNCRRDKKSIFKFSIVPIILIAAVFIYGTVRLLNKTESKSVRVGIYVTDENIKYFKSQEAEEIIPIIDDYIKQIEIMAKEGASVVLFPEKMVGITESYSSDIKNMLSKAAINNSVSIIIGVNIIGDTLSSNSAWVFSEDGELILNHKKKYLVPGWESGKYESGNRAGLFKYMGSTWGVNICKDNDFPKFTREYGKEDAKVVFAPTWDFIYDAEYHLRLAILRSVENGYSLVRSTKQGISTINDQYGEILKIGNSYNGDLIIVSDIEEGSGKTFYSRYGDWFSYLSIAILLVMVLSVIVRNLKSRDRRY